MNPQLAFVARLRRERLRHGISLDDIASITRVKRELLEAFEDNDLTDWPRGLYARAWVRAYASAVGLDPVETVDEFCRLYLHGDRRARSTMRDMAAIASEPSWYRDQPPQEERRRSERLAAEARKTWYSPLVQAWRAFRFRLVMFWCTYFEKPGRRHPRTSS